MNEALDISRAFADAVRAAEPAVVTVLGGRPDGFTGIAWSNDLVVTAAHALERSDEIEVVTGDTRLPATVLGADPGSDLGVLRIEGELTPARRADLGVLRVGELVVALSRPARGLRARLGIVSHLGGPFRLPGGQEVERTIESDIQPRPGHSGSVLVDVKGALVGLNNASVSRGSLVALPPNAVARVVDAIVQHGRVRRARIGVGLERVELPRAVAERRDQKRGLLVISVLEESPADKGGILLGDVLLSAGGQSISRVDDLMGALGEGAIGVPLELELLRAGVERKVALSPEAR